MAKEFIPRKSSREQDMNTNREVEKVLDKFYEGKFDFERVTDKARQIAGLDIVVTLPTGHLIFIDEKCAIDYINRELKTYSFELASTAKNGERREGWLISDKIHTTHYMLIYITKCKVDKHPKAEDIEEIEFIYIAKQSVVDYLKEKGLTKAALKEKVEYIDAGGLDYGDIKKDGFKFSKSKHKVEAPTNVIIPKEKLIEMSIYHGFHSP